MRKGLPLREVARRCNTSLATVQYWVRRAGSNDLNSVDWSDRSSRPHLQPHRTPDFLEDHVVRTRSELAAGELGFIGAAAIHDHLLHLEGLPSIRTIHRILRRRGLLDRPRRMRHLAPPPGWYLPDAAAGRAEIDHFDVIEDLRIEGGPLVEVLTGCPLWGSHVMVRPAESMGARQIVETLLQHWRSVGLPRYAQFDNDTRFQGGHNHPDVIGRVIRCCLALGITPVFAPPAEHGFQNIAEAFNGLWQRKVWQRFHHQSLLALTDRSDRFIVQYARHRLGRQEQVPPRRPFPNTFCFDVQYHPGGQLVYLRRTNEKGSVTVLGHRWEVDPNWSHRLVRAQVDLSAQEIRFFRLRRKEPMDQALLKQVAYRAPHRPFQDC